MGVARVAEAIAALDAQPARVGRPVATHDLDDLRRRALARDAIGELAADAAIRAQRVHAATRRRRRRRRAGRGQTCGQQRAGGTGLHAFAAADAGGGTHGLLEIEGDGGRRTAPDEADHVVDLHLATGAQAAGALDAGGEIDGDAGVAAIGRGLATGCEAAAFDAQPDTPQRQL